MTTQYRHASAADFKEALASVDFPASRDAIVKRASDRGGIDREVMHVLGRLSDRSYKSFEDVTAEVDRIYATMGGLPNAGPAAKKKGAAAASEDE